MKIKFNKNLALLIGAVVLVIIIGAVICWKRKSKEPYDISTQDKSQGEVSPSMRNFSSGDVPSNIRAPPRNSSGPVPERVSQFRGPIPDGPLRGSQRSAPAGPVNPFSGGGFASTAVEQAPSMKMNMPANMNQGSPYQKMQKTQMEMQYGGGNTGGNIPHMQSSGARPEDSRLPLGGAQDYDLV